MGWLPWSKGPLTAKKAPEETQQQEEKPPAPSVALQDKLPEGLAVALPRPNSIFEFGPSVTAGSEYMRGMCAGDNPDAIQACTWTVEPLQGKQREKKPLYRIEF